MRARDGSVPQGVRSAASGEIVGGGIKCWEGESFDGKDEVVKK